MHGLKRQLEEANATPGAARGVAGRGGALARGGPEAGCAACRDRGGSRRAPRRGVRSGTPRAGAGRAEAARSAGARTGAPARRRRSRRRVCATEAARGRQAARAPRGASRPASAPRWPSWASARKPSGQAARDGASWRRHDRPPSSAGARRRRAAAANGGRAPGGRGAPRGAGAARPRGATRWSWRCCRTRSSTARSPTCAPI